MSVSNLRHVLFHSCHLLLQPVLFAHLGQLLQQISICGLGDDLLSFFLGLLFGLDLGLQLLYGLCLLCAAIFVSLLGLAQFDVLLLQLLGYRLGIGCFFGL